MHEPFGVVALEAWAAGLPLAASKVGGIPAFVQDGINGLLFPSGDTQAAADAVIRLLSDPGFASGLARRGKQDMEAGYTWDAVSGRIGTIYDEVIAARRGKRRTGK